MNRKLCFIAVLGAAVAFSSCSKKLGQFKSDYFSVNPNPLEVVGEKVPATVTARVPQKFFVKNAEVTVTPYLVFNGTEVASQSYSFQGEKVRGNNPVISYENGGTVTIPVGYVYQPEMNQSVLELAFTVNQGSKQYVLPRVQVATGVVSTAALATAATLWTNSARRSLRLQATLRVNSRKSTSTLTLLPKVPRLGTPNSLRIVRRIRSTTSKNS